MITRSTQRNGSFRLTCSAVALAALLVGGTICARDAGASLPMVHIYVYTEIGVADVSYVDSYTDGHVYDPENNLVGSVDAYCNIVDSNSNIVGYIVQN